MSATLPKTEYLNALEISICDVISPEKPMPSLQLSSCTNGVFCDVYRYLHKTENLNALMPALQKLVPAEFKDNFVPANADMFRMRIKRITEAARGRNRKSILETIFDMSVKSLDTILLTPRKKKLKAQNSKLKKEKLTFAKSAERQSNELKRECRATCNQYENLNLSLRSENDQLSGTLENQEMEAECMKKQLVGTAQALETVKSSNKTITKRFAATKKHMNATKRKSSEILMNVVDAATEQVSTKSKNTETELSGVENPLISISAETNCDFVFKGMKHLGKKCKNNFRSGKEKYFAEIPILKKDSVTCGKKKIQQRARRAMHLLNFSAATENQQSEINVKNLLVEMMKQNPHLFSSAAEEAGISNTKMLSPEAAVNLQSLLRIPDNKIRNMRVALKKEGCQIWPSARKLKTVRDEKSAHVEALKVECGEMFLKRSARDEKHTACPYASIKDLKEFILATCKQGTFWDHPEFHDKIWILFSGDKGGDSMKFVFSIVNDKKVGSVDNNHIFSMYQGSDILENMWKVFAPYRADIEEMNSPDFRLGGKSVEVFLVGDYHFEDDMAGHGGSSSRYPSSVDFVTLDHLQHHPKSKHSLADCGIELRTKKHYQDYYSENRMNDDMRANAKFHYSVIDKMLFPLKDMSHLVPPALHIVLGVTLRLYNIVEEICKQMDNETDNVSEAEVKAKEAIELEWQSKSMELSECIENLKKTSARVVEFENIVNRFHAVYQGDHDENTTIAKLTNRKTDPKDYEGSCSSFLCCITKFDANPLFIMCDKCDKWCHSFCEGYSVAQEIALHDVETYQCLKCSGKVKSKDDLLKYIIEKSAEVLHEEDSLKLESVSLSVECDELKTRTLQLMGPRERSLNDYLSEINVIRQAYHSGTFVGNHCVAVLENSSKICDFIDGSELKDRLKELFALFARIQVLMFANRFLTVDEVSSLSGCCEKFALYMDKSTHFTWIKASPERSMKSFALFLVL